MFQLKSIIKGNYLQYVRSYSFLVTIALSLFVAFNFIPSTDANFSTVRFGEFTGNYNAAWIGFVTAIMSSVFLSLVGFFLINGSIKKDIDTRIGHIIGASKISNTKYLFAKLFSNVLILLTILVIIFVVSIVLFFFYSEKSPFQILDFVLPYAVIAIPSLFFVVSFSLLLEVLFPKKVFIQYLLFFIVFLSVLIPSSKNSNTLIDVFGIHYPTKTIEQQIKKKYPKVDTELTIGFIVGGRKQDKIVTVKSIHFTPKYVFGRLFWTIISFLLIYLSSFFFHRFSIKEVRRKQKNNLKKLIVSANFQVKTYSTTITESTKLLPLISIEMKLLFRKSKKWVLLLILCGMIATVLVSVSIAHNYILPLLWFLQVTLWSDLVTKDTENRTHYFTASSYKPLQRIFVSRIIAGIFAALFVAIPLLIKLLFSLEFLAFIHVILGAVFIVLLAIFLGVLTKSKKLFEILFFFIAYSNINLVEITDYYGAIHNTIWYTGFMFFLIIILFLSSYFFKKNRMRYE